MARISLGATDLMLPIPIDAGGVVGFTCPTGMVAVKRENPITPSGIYSEFDCRSPEIVESKITWGDPILNAATGSWIGGIPNWALMVAAGLVGFALVTGKKRRRW